VNTGCRSNNTSMTSARFIFTFRLATLMKHCTSSTKVTFGKMIDEKYYNKYYTIHFDCYKLQLLQRHGKLRLCITRETSQMITAYMYIIHLQTNMKEVTYTPCSSRIFMFPCNSARRWLQCYTCRESAVDILTGYGLDDRGVGVRVPVSSRIFSFPRRPDQLWGPPSLLSNAYRGLFLRR
jgi:hypothetical protein